MSVNAAQFAPGTSGGKYFRASSSVGGFQGVSATTVHNATWQTSLDITGAGIIDFLSIQHDTANNLNIRITVDGTLYDANGNEIPVVNTIYTMIGTPTVSGNSQYIGSGIQAIAFKQSLKIEFNAASGSTFRSIKYRLGSWETI